MKSSEFDFGKSINQSPATVSGNKSLNFGTFPVGIQVEKIIERAKPIEN